MLMFRQCFVLLGLYDCMCVYSWCLELLVLVLCECLRVLYTYLFWKGGGVSMCDEVCCM